MMDPTSLNISIVPLHRSDDAHHIFHDSLFVYDARLIFQGIFELIECHDILCYRHPALKDLFVFFPLKCERDQSDRIISAQIQDAASISPIYQICYFFPAIPET